MATAPSGNENFFAVIKVEGPADPGDFDAFKKKLNTLVEESEMATLTHKRVIDKDSEEETSFEPENS